MGGIRDYSGCVKIIHKEEKSRFKPYIDKPETKCTFNDPDIIIST